MVALSAATTLGEWAGLQVAGPHLAQSGNARLPPRWPPRPEQVFHGGLFLFAPAALAPLAPRLNAWLVEVLVQPDVVRPYREASIEPTPVNLARTADSVRRRQELVDGMRLAVFGRTR